MSIRRKIFLTACSALTVMAISLTNTLAQEGGGPEGFPDLVGGLKAVEGCLGVETAQTASGKNVIFAWFKDKESVLRWYYSDMHQGVVKKFFPERGAGKPLDGVADDIGPIMAIASITMSDKAHFSATGLPISQIAIELYAPVTGGIFLGGRFAPDSLEVPNMQDYTPKP